MTIQQRPWANDPALSTDAVQARIAQYCAWFDLTPPKLMIRKGSIYLTDALQRWMIESGASFDWIFRGNARGMAHLFRREMLYKIALLQPVGMTPNLGEPEDADPVSAASALERLHDERIFLAFLRSLTPDERAKLHEALTGATPGGLTGFLNSYAQSRGPSPS